MCCSEPFQMVYLHRCDYSDVCDKQTLHPFGCSRLLWMYSFDIIDYFDLPANLLMADKWLGRHPNGVMC